MKILTRILCGVSMLALVACSHSATSTSNLDAARQAIDNGNFGMAAETLDAAAAQLNDTTASPAELARLAVMYMIVNDHLVESDFNLKALEAYRRALKLNADSVSSYVATLPPSETQYVFILRSLSSSIDNASNMEIPDFDAGEYIEETDSLDIENQES